MAFRAYLDEFLSLEPPAGGNLVVVEAIDSTQRLASRLVGEYIAEGRPVPDASVFAFEQTAGRGRRGRSWASPPGSGVFATLVRRLRRDSAIRNLPLLMAVSLAHGLDEFLGAEQHCGLKWPNDLLVTGRKLGGILIDIKPHGNEEVVALLGFGINHSHKPEDLPITAATSLLANCSQQQPPSLAQLASRLWRQMEEDLGRLDDVDWLLETYRQKSVHQEGDSLSCQIGERIVRGTFQGFDSQGNLRLTVADGEELITAGEILEGDEFL